LPFGEAVEVQRKGSTTPGVVPERKDARQMIKVKSRGNETVEQMIRRFKKACEKEGLTKDIKRVAYYEKPSEKRRRRSRSKPRIMSGPMRG
jgi:small subunit ribosomal protein S21